MLVTHNGGKSFETVRNAIVGAGYSFIPFVLKTHEYTEIPQGREGIYIVGFRREPEYFFAAPVKINSQMNFGNVACSAAFKKPSVSESEPKSVRYFLEHSTVQPGDYCGKSDSKIHLRVREEVTDENKVYQYQRWYVRENKSNVCPTPTASMGFGGHNIPIILDGDTPRRLTPKECFNLQGVPANFQLPDDVPEGQLYKQSSNTINTNYNLNLN